LIVLCKWRAKDIYIDGRQQKSIRKREEETVRNQNQNQLLRAPTNIINSLDRHNSLRVNEGRNGGGSLLAIKCKARTVVGEEGEEPTLLTKI